MPDVVQITLPDGSSKQVPAGTTVFEFVKTRSSIYPVRWTAAAS